MAADRPERTPPRPANREPGLDSQLTNRRSLQDTTLNCPSVLSEDPFRDHHPLDLVGALVDLGARFRGSSGSPLVR
jgi:hypothetical protein